MTVRVLFFAYLRERAGTRETTVELPDGASVDDLRRQLRVRYEGLDLADNVRMAVNRVYVDNPYVLHDNDELALIPPVSGG